MTDTYKHADDVPLATREMLYAHEILRTVGVPAADIFVTYEVFESGPHLGNLGVFAVVIKQGKRSVPLVGFPTPMPEQEALEAWHRAVPFWNRTCNDESVGWNLDGSHVRLEAVPMIAAMELAGIKFGRD